MAHLFIGIKQKIAFKQNLQFLITSISFKEFWKFLNIPVWRLYMQLFLQLYCLRGCLRTYVLN